MMLNMHYKCKLVEWVEMCSEQCYKCQIHDSNPRPGVLEDSRLASSPLIALTIMSS